MDDLSDIIVAGVDVSKAQLDVVVLPGDRYRRWSYDLSGLEQLVQWLRSLEVGMVVLEASGGLERRLVGYLASAGLSWHVANPRQVRDFARATGQLAKTDKIDGRVIALMGRKLRPKAHVLPEKSRQTLKAGVARYEQLMCMRIAERNRLDRCDDSQIEAMTQRMIDQIDRQLEQVLAWMDRQVDADTQLREQVRRVESVPGIGRLTAVRLVAMTPELGQCNRQQIARLIGVAPINRDSGTLRGKRTTGGGRRAVRKLLYMPTIVATRYNPVIRVTYQHLLAQGKPKMVALIACMRKLIILINSMAREQQTWRQFLPQT